MDSFTSLDYSSEVVIHSPLWLKGDVTVSFSDVLADSQR